ncbi:MAG: hypothetical protein DMF66_20050, partial [Acidobacteria bacterium]
RDFHSRFFIAEKLMTPLAPITSRRGRRCRVGVRAGCVLCAGGWRGVSYYSRNGPMSFSAREGRKSFFM